MIVTLVAQFCISAASCYSQAPAVYDGPDAYVQCLDEARQARIDWSRQVTLSSTKGVMRFYCDVEPGDEEPSLE